MGHWSCLSVSGYSTLFPSLIPYDSTASTFIKNAFQLTNRAKAFPLGTYPPEVRQLILKAITQQKHPGWASAAAVSKEWQAVIEKENFGHLTLNRRCLRGFEDILKLPLLKTGRKKTLSERVEHIHLDIELVNYDCTECQSGGEDSESFEVRDSVVIMTTIRWLLEILSTWRSRKEGRGLTLEISAHSPSDSEHWFKNFHFKSARNRNNGAQVSVPATWHDQQHGCIDGNQVSLPSWEAVARLFERSDDTGLEMSDYRPVKAVTALNLRRHIRRWFQPGSRQLLELLDMLRELEHFNYEPWRKWDEPTMFANDAGFFRTMQDHFPHNVKTLTIFEDSNQTLDDIFLSHSHPPDDVPRTVSRITSPVLAAQFADESRFLEQLSIAYMINAEDFFNHAKTFKILTFWTKFRSLALTSQLLRRESLADGNKLELIDDMLINAALVARKMRQLQTLVLWNCIKGQACAFIYQRERGTRRSCITWRGTWELKLSREVIQAWENAAEAITEDFWGGAALRFEVQRVEGGIRSHGDAISLLDLPVEVVGAESLWQIRKENENTRVAA